jgi:phospholipid/cholesterol/gamma-HCH transport system ATP-binding protein
VIRTEHISKSFEGRAVLQNVSFGAEAGQCVFVCGRSGSGKSVLIKIITGLLPADGGTLWIDDQDATGFTDREWNALRRNIGVVFQNAALLGSLSVFENVGIRLLEDAGGRATSEVTARVSAALQQVGLTDAVLPQLPAQLSGGMRKRVGIARAVVHNPAYLIYDEPTTGLDPLSAARINDLIGTLAQGRTSIVVSHDMHSLAQLATHVLLIENQTTHFWGTKEEFMNSTDAVVRAFLQQG